MTTMELSDPDEPVAATRPALDGAGDPGGDGHETTAAPTAARQSDLEVGA